MGYHDKLGRMEAALLEEYEDSIDGVSYLYPSNMERFLIRKIAGLMLVVDGQAEHIARLERGES